MKKNVRKLSLKVSGFIISLLMTQYAFASTYSIGTGGGSAFDKITSLLQDWADFMTGPFGKFVVVIALVIGAIVWAVMPKHGVLAVVLRAIIAGAVLLNISLWMGWLGG